jgi:hypothetical protein
MLASLARELKEIMSFKILGSRAGPEIDGAPNGLSGV